MMLCKATILAHISSAIDLQRLRRFAGEHTAQAEVKWGDEKMETCTHLDNLNGELEESCPLKENFTDGLQCDAVCNRKVRS